MTTIDINRFFQTRAFFAQAAKNDPTPEMYGVFEKTFHLGLNCITIAEGDVEKASYIYALVCECYKYCGFGESIVIGNIKQIYSYVYCDYNRAVEELFAAIRRAKGYNF